MSHPYAIQPVTSGVIQNGSMVTLVFESAENTQIRTPELNSFISSGVLNVRTSGRFDEHYGGGAS